MTRTLYVTSSEPDSGKSIVALGLIELLRRTVKRVGVFRPIARTTRTRDWVLELMLGHEGIELGYDEAVGVTYDEVIADPEVALATIVSRFHEVERRHDAVVVVGTDYTDVLGPTELAFNARIAANIGAPVVLVLRADAHSPADVQHLAEVAVGELHANHAQVVGTIATKVDPKQLDEVRTALSTDVPVWVVPDEPLLYAPTFSQIVDAVGGSLLWGDAGRLDREVLGVTVGAMAVEHVLTRVGEDSAVIIPGDRTDVLLGLLMAHHADGFPNLAGIVLNGGFTPVPVIAKLLDGISTPLPIVGTDLGTFDAASAAAAVKGSITHDSHRKIDTALSLFAQHVDGPALLASLDVPRPEVVTPLMFEYQLLERARSDRRHIVLPEGEDDRILRAAAIVLQRRLADLTLLGDETAIRARASALGLDLAAATVRDPKRDPVRERFAEEYARLRAHKGTTLEWAHDVVASPTYFGTMMVQLALADGMVSGATHTTADTIRPAFEIIRTAPGISNVSSVFLMCLQDQVLVYGDCAIFPDPSAAELADIAIASAATAQQFGIEPRVAMLSYSTGESGHGVDVDKVRDATALVRQRHPDLLVEGPIQYDAAVEPSVARTKMPDSQVAGRATVLVFPDLNTGNNTYKAVQRSSGAVAIGPVLQGLRKPVNDLSRGALVQDIVNTIAITALQAQNSQSSEQVER